MENYSAIKKDEIMPFAATWSEVSQAEKDKYRITITYMWNLKKSYKSTYLQNRNRPIDKENKLMITNGEKVRGRDKLKVWD